ncbi:hypothetical protein BsWGS_25752 [Bradybaena similaris]
MRADVILPAAGASERMNLPVSKQFLTVLGKHILAYTVDSFHRFPWIRHIVVVVSADQIDFTKELLKSYGFTRTNVCAGSHTRHRSIFCGLKTLKSECSGKDVVIIHDAARPFVPEQVAKDVAEAASTHGAAGVTRPLVSTVIRADDDARLVESLDRRLYTNSEMPQAFHYGVITSAYGKCSKDDLDFGTECLLLAMKYSQCRAALVQGTDDLWKVTYQKDVYSLESIIKEKFMVVSIIQHDLELLALKEFQSRLLQQVKVAEGTEVPANTFVITWNLQTCCNPHTIDDTVSKICACYNLDMPSSAVKLDLMVVIVFLETSHPSSSQPDYQAKIFSTSSHASTAPSESWSLEVQSPSIRTTRMYDSFQLDNRILPQDTDERNDHVTKVSFIDAESLATYIPISDNILNPSPNCQANSTELPNVQTEFKNSLAQSSVSLTQPVSDSHERQIKQDAAFKSVFNCQTFIQIIKAKVSREVAGKSALVVGVSCRPEAAISEQLAQLVWQRSSYTDGQVFIF